MALRDQDAQNILGDAHVNFNRDGNLAGAR
jgi:hypothetical protein